MLTDPDHLPSWVTKDINFDGYTTNQAKAALVMRKLKTLIYSEWKQFLKDLRSSTDARHRDLGRMLSYVSNQPSYW